GIATIQGKSEYSRAIASVRVRLGVRREERRGSREALRRPAEESREIQKEPGSHHAFEGGCREAERPSIDRVHGAKKPPELASVCAGPSRRVSMGPGRRTLMRNQTFEVGSAALCPAGQTALYPSSSDHRKAIEQHPADGSAVPLKERGARGDVVRLLARVADDHGEADRDPRLPGISQHLLGARDGRALVHHVENALATRLEPGREAHHSRCGGVL